MNKNEFNISSFIQSNQLLTQDYYIVHSDRQAYDEIHYMINQDIQEHLQSMLKLDFQYVLIYFIIMISLRNIFLKNALLCRCSHERV